MTSSTSDHDAAQLRPSQGGDDVGTLRLHQVLHHQEAEETHVCLHLSPAERNEQAGFLSPSFVLFFYNTDNLRI